MKQWEENINLLITVDSANEGYKGNIGLITKYIEGLDIKDIYNAQVVVVGPPMMMKFTVAEFLKRGIREENLWVSYERKMVCAQYMRVNINLSTTNRTENFYKF